MPVGQVKFAGVVLGESHRCLGSVSGQFTAPFVVPGAAFAGRWVNQCCHVREISSLQ
jgi:hypothetical protein